MKSSVPAGVLSLVLALSAQLARAAENPYEWLERMSAAMSQMTYQGTFVYVQGDDVETMRITHVAEAGGSRERLVSLSGVPREVIRDAAGVRWFSGDRKGGVADAAANRPIFFELPLSDAAQASDSYDFSLDGDDRVAGHAATRLQVRPRDRYRYGYTFWLEAQSALPLQWQVRDQNGATLAQLMFTELRIGSEVDRGELHSARAAADAAEMQSALPAEARSARAQPAWAPAAVPPGFRLASHRGPDNGGAPGFEHLIYSDGIAAVSVYIENAARKSKRKQGTSRMGTTHAFFRPLEGRFVTVVGDVPEDTVKLIGEAVGPVDP